MKILDYEYSGDNWKFNKIDFQDINLIVGDSGSGKTRLLNTIFNLGTYVAQGKISRGNDHWRLTLEISGKLYHWEVTTSLEADKAYIKEESLHMAGEPIFERSDSEFIFQGEKSLKLPTDQMAISIYKEEELLKPLFDGFSKILRRKFFSDAIVENSGIYAVNEKSLNKLGEKRDLFEIYKVGLGMNPKLYLLSKFFPEIYEKIVGYFREAFPFITDINILYSDAFDTLDVPGRAPILSIKEANVKTWIRLDDLSSGMQKTLLILTDLFSSPKDSIYLIDEYENSLGISAINSLPNVLFSEDIDMQIIVTSHHPYIISKFPVENWYIAHRRGSEVYFEYGDRLVNKYNVSSQDKYIQLLNDPHYSEGIE